VDSCLDVLEIYIKIIVDKSNSRAVKWLILIFYNCLNKSKTKKSHFKKIHFEIGIYIQLLACLIKCFFLLDDDI